MDEFIRRFEAGTLRKEEWTHAAHLRMAHWYVWSHGEAEAGLRIRAGIRHLNECMGVANTEESFHQPNTQRGAKYRCTKPCEERHHVPISLRHIYVHDYFSHLKNRLRKP